MPNIPINPADVKSPVGTYSHGIVVPDGRLLFISGQIPELTAGNVPAGFEAQCCAVWENIGRILRDAGGTFSSLVKVTTFLTDRRQADHNGRIRRHYLGEHAPAVTVVVASTLEPQWLLEIEAVAVIL